MPGKLIEVTHTNTAVAPDQEEIAFVDNYLQFCFPLCNENLTQFMASLIDHMVRHTDRMDIVNGHMGYRYVQAALHGEITIDTCTYLCAMWNYTGFDAALINDSDSGFSLMDPCYREYGRGDFLSDDFFEVDFSSGWNNSNCTGPIPTWTHSDKPLFIQVFGEKMYAWLTPVILIIGILGNSLSLSVFSSKNMRSLSASNYLAALSLADLLTLIFFVFVQWLTKGLKLLPGHIKVEFLAVAGVCHILIYLGYIFRFLSAWLVVIFTVERYIGVCHPLQRRSISTSSSRKIILCLVLVSAILLLYKPVLSGPVEIRGEFHCTSLKEHIRVSEILDGMYGVLITLVPFILITALNLLIIRKLVQRNRRQRECSVTTEESIIRLEFTLILLAISLCFIAFNLPYFAFWLQTVAENKQQKNTYKTTNRSYVKGVLYIVRTIFYLNYCVNFFLYSITGAYFRREVRMMFRYKMSQKMSYSKGSKALNQNSHTHQSWKMWASLHRLYPNRYPVELSSPVTPISHLEKHGFLEEEKCL